MGEELFSIYQPGGRSRKTAYAYQDCLAQNQAEAGSHAEAMPINRDEFFCPMCRQLSNAVLPMVPDDNCFPLVPMVAQDPSVMVAHLAEMIYQTPERTVRDFTVSS